MRIIALWIGKIIYHSLRLVGRRGAALPGLIIKRFFPSFLAKSLMMLPEGVIIVTGTNGKTTSTKMLTHILGPEKRVLTNPTGSNFVRGIIASIIQHSRWLGTLPYDIAVFELDEAYAAKFVDEFKPRAVVVLNIMRDQMDRFGEIDHTAKLVKKVVEKATDFIVLNRDDPRVTTMSDYAKKKVYYFGVSTELRNLYRNDDEIHEAAPTNSVTKKALVELTDVKKNGKITFMADDKSIDLSLTAKSTYNAQNAIAVCVTALALGFSIDNITPKLAQVKPAFGRGERIKLGSKNINLQLVKNPGGFRHALLSGAQSKYDATIIAINDDYADGRDVSWLWDVSFEGKEGLFNPIITSGTRAADMALRLKYDNVQTQSINSDLIDCLQSTLKNIPANGSILVYTTYTAMLELRKSLAKITEVEKV